jgi:type 1 glutamine amidotransferase
MRTLAVVLLLSVSAAAQNTSKVYATAKRPRALVLVGDRYHSPVYIREGLAPALLQENIPATFIEDVNALNAESLRDCQLLIILRDGMNWPNGYTTEPLIWMTDAQQQAIWDFVERGGGFLALHNAQARYTPGGPYYKLFGGDFISHPKPYTFTVRIENKDHPITAGVNDFEIFDEQHMNKYYLDHSHMLLRSIAKDNTESPAGWWNEAGKGRFCYMAPGHTAEALNHPMMQRLIRNAMNWVLRQ